MSAISEDVLIKQEAEDVYVSTTLQLHSPADNWTGVTEVRNPMKHELQPPTYEHDGLKCNDAGRRSPDECFQHFPWVCRGKNDPERCGCEFPCLPDVNRLCIREDKTVPSSFADDRNVELNSLHNLKKHKHGMGERQYKCERRSIAFSTESDLKTHVPTHEKSQSELEEVSEIAQTPADCRNDQPDILALDRPYKCSHCCLTFSQKGALNAHKRVHVDKHLLKTSKRRRKIERLDLALPETAKSYKCGDCGARFGSQRGFVKHAQSHTDGKRNSFQVSSETLSNGNSHTYKRTGENLLSLNCGNGYSSQNVLQTHTSVVRHADEFTCKCNSCGCTFLKESSLEIHKCKSCSTISSNDTCNLSNKLNQNHNEFGQLCMKPFTCADCGNSFSTKYSLREHSRVVHDGDKPFTCEHCSKAFGSKSTLKKHSRRVHKGDKPHMCSECGLACVSRSDLEKHLRIHTGETEFKCEVCVASFSCRSYLNRHMLVHTGEKRFKCETCEKRFAYRSHLQIHFRVHTRERPYKCDMCGMSVGSKHGLKAHNRLHSGEKPYRCSECGRTFVQRSNLDQHARTHRDDKPYVCGRCGVGFTAKRSLQDHVRLCAAKNAES